ncbi:hypothetical protein HDU78_000759 [Chytriomyces hyalinus]|nr:hypothetical protein HDU78_000759 [Chytriomyces hyalinus]
MTIGQIQLDMDTNTTVVQTGHFMQMEGIQIIPTTMSKETPKRSGYETDGSDYEFLANNKRILPKPPKGIEEDQPPATVDPQVDITATGQAKEPDGNEEPAPPVEQPPPPPPSTPPPLSVLPDFLPTPQHQPFHNFFRNDFHSDSTQEDDAVRREKSFILNEFNTKNVGNRYSPKAFTMSDPLHEIKNELEFITAKRDIENQTKTWKRGLLLFVDGVVHLNSTYYNPFDVDLSDWSKEMHWNVFQENTYDDVFQELIQKWRGKIKMSPEVKLLGMMGSSLMFGIMSKKREKALLASRAREQQQLEERVRAQVREEMREEMSRYQTARSTSPRSEHSPRPRSPRPRSPQQQQFRGPTLTESQMVELMQRDFIDSDEESVGAQSVASKTSKISLDERMTQEAPSSPIPTVVDVQSEPVKVKPTRRGRPPGQKRAKPVPTVVDF